MEDKRIDDLKEYMKDRFDAIVEICSSIRIDLQQHAQTCPIKDDVKDIRETVKDHGFRLTKLERVMIAILAAGGIATATAIGGPQLLKIIMSE